MAKRSNDNEATKSSSKLRHLVKDIAVASTLIFSLLLAAWALTSS